VKFELHLAVGIVSHGHRKKRSKSRGNREKYTLGNEKQTGVNGIHEITVKDGIGNLICNLVGTGSNCHDQEFRPYS
jgi:hypothetical protein